MEALAKALLNFGRHWELDGDRINCKGCHRVQHISYRDMFPEHAAYCESPVQNDKPWITLSGLLNVPEE